MKKITRKIAVALLIFTFICASSHAQTLEDIKGQMVNDWERAKAYTIDYLNTMPADKYSFKAVDSIRSFAQQMLHLSQGNGFLMSTGTSQPMPAYLASDIEHRASAQTKDSVLYFVTASYDFCLNSIKNADVKKWFEKKKIAGKEETTFAIMNKTFEHQTHHRGQATIYIRLQGIKPPNERLF